ncbi:helix-turn-helix domain-containing protein [Streptomyces sp. NPDC013953]|uniref:helix-turn-helix domain-containing protein n=1 Tax=Streptomyces sp. NPDC013953 TaxID=3364868 RepID=UPI0036FF764F
MQIERGVHDGRGERGSSVRVSAVDAAFEDSGGTRVSDRTFRILGALRDLGDGPHALRSIVDRSGLSRSTVQRHILAGMRGGFIRQPRHGHYALAAGSGLLATAGAVEPGGVPDARRRALELLGQESGLVARLHAAILTDVPALVCVARYDVPRAAGGAADRGEAGESACPLDAEADAAGQVVLAHLGLPGLDPGVQEEIRERGWSVSPVPRRGTEPPGGTLMVAVPILRFGGPVGALSVTGPQAVVEGSVPACVVALRRAVRLLSQRTVSAMVPRTADRRHRGTVRDRSQYT